MSAATRAGAQAAFARGDKATALVLLEQVCDSGGGTQDWLSLARLRQHLGDLNGAVSAALAAHAREPASADNARAVAQLLAKCGAFAQAIDVLEPGHAQHPDDSELATDLALVYELSGDPARARALYDETINTTPNAFRARLNRAANSRDSGAHASALADYDMLIGHYPEAVIAVTGRAECLRLLGRFAECVSTCDALLAREPEHINAQICQAVALASMYELERAQALIEHVWQLDRAAVADYAGITPTTRTAPDARSLYLMSQFVALGQADWTGFEDLAQRCTLMFADPALAPSDLDLAFTMLFFPVSNRVTSRAHTAISAAVTRLPAPRLEIIVAQARITVGFATSKFREHPAMYLTRGMYRAFDRGQFEIVGYSLGDDDGGSMRRDIASEFDRFVDLSAMDDAEAIASIAADNVNILVDLDGYSDDARVAVLAAHPAHLQVGYLSHLHSLFAPWIDYRVTCKHSEPLDWGLPLIESRVFMPHAFFPYGSPMTSHAIPANRTQHGLANDAFVFCAFGQAAKICPQVFGIWMQLLQDVADAILWLDDCSEAARLRLRYVAQSHGICPDRLVFAPRLPYLDHLNRLRLADIFLDTFKCNAHTTALDALHAGLPIVTCRGESWSGRIGASFLHSVGLEELVSESPATYRALAYDLALDRPRVSALKTRLAACIAQNRPFDSRRMARSFEQAFTLMWARYGQGLGPQDLEISPLAS